MLAIRTQLSDHFANVRVFLALQMYTSMSAVLPGSRLPFLVLSA